MSLIVHLLRPDRLRASRDWLTLVSGWGMSLVYLIVLFSTVRAVLPGRSMEKLS